MFYLKQLKKIEKKFTSKLESQPQRAMKLENRMELY